MSEFVKALLECREVSKIPEQYDWFAPLLEDWEFDYYDVKNGKRERHVDGAFTLPEVLAEVVYVLKPTLRISRFQTGFLRSDWVKLF